MPGAGACTAAEVAFGESTSRVVLSVSPEQVAAVLGAASAAGVPVATIGHAGGDQCTADAAFSLSLASAKQAWMDAIPNLMSPTAP